MVRTTSMNLVDKYNHLLILTKTIVWYDKVKYERGYLTLDEKNKLIAARKELRKLKPIPKQLSL
jgi:hypothetical protein